MAKLNAAEYKSVVNYTKLYGIPVSVKFSSF